MPFPFLSAWWNPHCSSRSRSYITINISWPHLCREIVVLPLLLILLLQHSPVWHFLIVRIVSGHLFLLYQTGLGPMFFSPPKSKGLTMDVCWMNKWVNHEYISKWFNWRSKVWILETAFRQSPIQGYTRSVWQEDHRESKIWKFEFSRNLEWWIIHLTSV